MRITQQSERELLLEDSGRGLVAFGALFVTVSAIVAGGALREGKGWVALLVTAVFGIAGIVMIVKARAQTHHFDLRRGILTIASRPTLALLGTTLEVVTHPLETLQDVVLTESHNASGTRAHSRTYRLEYVFADGARRPLRPYYTTGRTGYAAIQDALRAALARARRG